MNLRLRYREGQFSASETAACTGLALTMQRDWRSLGHLPPRTSGRASFSPHDLAKISLMVVLRGLGVSLAECRQWGDDAAPSILFFALGDYAKGLAVEPDDERGDRYRTALSHATEERYFDEICGCSPKDARSYIVMRPGHMEFLGDLKDLPGEGRIIATTIIDLSAIAAGLLEAAPRPLFTLVVPASFEQEQAAGGEAA